jgi:hypothetical protein
MHFCNRSKSTKFELSHVRHAEQRILRFPQRHLCHHRGVCSGFWSNVWRHHGHATCRLTGAHFVRESSGNLTDHNNGRPGAVCVQPCAMRGATHGRKAVAVTPWTLFPSRIHQL